MLSAEKFTSCQKRHNLLLAGISIDDIHEIA